MTSGGKAASTALPEKQQKGLNNVAENNMHETTNNTENTTKVEENNGEEEREINNDDEEVKQTENSQQEQKSPQKQNINLRPDEYTDGLWDAEPFYYCTNGPTTARGYYISNDEHSATGKRQKRGLIFKKRENITGGTSNEYECFQSHEGIVYRPGDHVFVESCREDPFLVGSIVSFKMKKRDQLLVKLLRYYRSNDVPELSFSLVTQARIEEDQYHQSAAAPHSLHCRELFSSETTLLFHVAALRGKCSVHLVKDLRTAFAEIDLTDESAFFHCLNYNQESGRLASVQMSIKVGSAYQANIPSCSSSTLSDDPDRDELLYRPGYLCAETEEKYVKMARTFRTFSLLNNKRITMLEKAARTGDLLLDDAVVALHRSGYSVMDAINTMQAIDTHLTTDSSFMNADDVKKFGKGIKQYGKNFNKINKDLLGNHNREQLIAFYYLWKKSAHATRPKPLGNAKRTQVSVTSVGRRGKNSTTINGNGNCIVNVKRLANTAEETPPPSTDLSEANDLASKSSNSCTENSASPLDELQDYASASETETEQLDQQPGGVGRACHHCFTSKSVDWHHAGHDRLLLMCTECRVFYKRYGQLRPVDRPSTVPPCLLLTANATTSRQNSEEEDENEEPVGNGRSNRLRTRGGRNLSQRTPSLVDLMESGNERLRGTPQKIEEERRSTPLRNSAGKTGRKRGVNKGNDPLYEESTPTPPKGKRSKKVTTSNTSPPSSLPSNNSRTPSPPTTTSKEDDNLVENNNNTNTNRKRISKKEKERLRQERSNSKEKVDLCDGDEATNNTVNIKKVKLERADSHAGVVTPQPENINEMPASSSFTSPFIVNSSQQQPIKEENVVNEENSEKISENQKQQTIELEKQNIVASPKNSPLIGAATIISRKPVAKVEPLETNKEETKHDNIETQQTLQETNQQQQQKQQTSTNIKDEGEEEPSSTTIICVDFSSDEEGENNKEENINNNSCIEEDCEQDCGPLGENVSIEIYSTCEEKKDIEGKLIPIEFRTILERRLKRVSGITCARTDIAFLEPPERAKYNKERREHAERERLKKEQEKAARQQQILQQKQLASSNVVPIVQPLKKMEMPAEFNGQQQQPQQQQTQSLIYLPNGQCATIPFASISGNIQQQQHPLHHQLLINGSLNTNGNIQGVFSQFNSLNQTIQPQQSNDVSSTVHPSTSSITSTLSTSTTSITTQSSFQNQQQHPLVAISTGTYGQPSLSLATHQQTLLPSSATQMVNQAQAAAAALFQQQQQQQDNALLMQMLMSGDPRIMQQLQALFHIQQQQQHSQQTFVSPSTSMPSSTATTNTASAPIPTPNIVAQQHQQHMLQQQMQLLLGLDQKQQLEQFQRQQQQQKNAQQKAGSVASTSNNISTPHQHLPNGFTHQNNTQQHKLSSAGFVGQGNNNVTPSQHFSQTFAQKSKKETSTAARNQQQQQAAIVKQLFCGSQTQNLIQHQQSTAVATMLALQQHQQKLNASNSNNASHFQQQQQQCSNANNLQQQQASFAAEIEAFTAALQQQQQQQQCAVSNAQQQQQLQEMLAMFAAGGAGLSQQDQRLLEEQIKMLMQTQQQKQLAAVHAQQQQQTAQQQQAQQHQQIMAAFAAAGNIGPEQLFAAQHFAQQFALQQQQQQNQQQTSSSTNQSAFLQQQQQQQFQQQLMQIMAMQQKPQHQNTSFGNTNYNGNQQQQLTLEQQHLFQQQFEMFRRQSSQNISNSTLQQRNSTQEQSEQQRR